MNVSLKCKVYFSFEGVFFDHRIVSPESIRHKHLKLLDIIGDQYRITVRNKLNTLQEISEMHTPNDEYENFFLHVQKQQLGATKQRAKSRESIVII